jgi:FKBP-type peptidyl-prolyl cis-trans isomerase
MRNFLPIALVVIVFLAGCKDNPDIMLERERRLLEQYLEQNNITVEPLSNGIYYLESVVGTGEAPATGDYVIVEYTASLIDGKVFDTTSEEVAAAKGILSPAVLYGNSKFKLMNTPAKGIEEGLKLMKEGGEARLIIPSVMGYGSSSSTSVPAYSTLIFDIKLNKVIKDPVAYEALELADYIDLYTDSLDLTLETVEYVSDALTTDWYFIELEEGTGDSIKKDFTVYIYYEGKLVDGRVFDKNFGNSTAFSFKVEGGTVIKGMDLAVKKMKKDAKARVIVPSSLGYGEAGSGKIPPFSPLVFDILVSAFDTVATPQ